MKEEQGKEWKTDEKSDWNHTVHLQVLSQDPSCLTHHKHAFTGTVAAQHFPLTLTQYSSSAQKKDDHYKGDDNNMRLTSAWILCHPINSAAIEECSMCVFVSVWDWQLCVCAHRAESKREKHELRAVLWNLFSTFWFVANNCFPWTHL